jgi:hypothetical protein
MYAMARALGWACIILGCALSPAIVALGVPLGYGIGSDIIESAWLPPIALIMAAAIAFNVRRRRVAAQPAANSIT